MLRFQLGSDSVIRLIGTAITVIRGITVIIHAAIIVITAVTHTTEHTTGGERITIGRTELTTTSIIITATKLTGLA